MIEFRTLTLQDISHLLESSGLNVGDDLSFAGEHGLFKYIGCAAGKARYLIGFVGDDELHYASVVLVYIGGDRLKAEYAGAVEWEGDSFTELAEYIDRRCN